MLNRLRTGLTQDELGTQIAKNCNILETNQRNQVKNASKNGLKPLSELNYIQSLL